MTLFKASDGEKIAASAYAEDAGVIHDDAVIGGAYLFKDPALYVGQLSKKLARGEKLAAWTRGYQKPSCSAVI